MVLPSTYYIGVIQGNRVLCETNKAGWPIYVIIGGATGMTLFLWIIGAVSPRNAESCTIYFCTYGERDLVEQIVHAQEWLKVPGI